MSWELKKRKAISKWRTMSVMSSLAASALNESMTPIVFKGSGAYLVTGAESQQVYCFSSHDPEQMIETRDADALLRTGLFRTRS